MVVDGEHSNSNSKKGFLEQRWGLVLGEGEQRRGVVAFRSFVDQIMELRWGQWHWGWGGL
jgi:hypothetical protein